jgi:tripartite-type tricarboxylate transporter receptor subunit TctC
MQMRWSARAFLRLAAMVMAAVMACTSGAEAQSYPTRPIEVIVPWGPGGGADQTGRMIGKLLEQELKVSFPVENIPGASGVTGLNKLLNGRPEGYQVALLTADTLTLLAAPRPQRWKLDDLAPIAVLIKQTSGFFGKADGPLATWADVEARAKTTEVKVGVTGLGSPEELAVLQMSKKRGLKLIAVPFARPAERYASVIGGHTDLVYEQAGDLRSFIENKQLKPLLFLATKKVEPFVDVPTTKDLGLDLVLDQFRTIMTKAGTPPDRLKLLQEAVAKVGTGKDYAAFLAYGWADPNSVIVGDEAKAYIEAQIKALKNIWQ